MKVVIFKNADCNELEDIIQIIGFTSESNFIKEGEIISKILTNFISVTTFEEVIKDLRKRGHLSGGK